MLSSELSSYEVHWDSTLGVPVQEIKSQILSFFKNSFTELLEYKSDTLRKKSENIEETNEE